MKPYYLIGQKAVIQDKQGRILLLKRAIGFSEGGRWDFAGGGLEANEDPSAGLKREIFEESGLRVRDIIPRIIYSVKDKNYPALIIFYSAKTPSTKITLSSEHDDFMWLNKRQVLKLKIPKIMKDLIKLI